MMGLCSREHEMDDCGHNVLMSSSLWTEPTITREKLFSRDSARLLASELISTFRLTDEDVEVEVL